MKNQDPLNPTDSSEYMGQMTQFSILEQITNLGQTSSAAAANDYDQQAIALIGRSVTYLKDDGTSGSGTVDQVTFSSRGPALTIGGTAGILPAFVTEVR
jgi:flagellar basal-body rod modification protein FlgD